MSKIRQRRSARRSGWTSTAEGWSSAVLSQRGRYGVAPVVIQASVLGRLLGLRLLRLEADISLFPVDLGSSSTVGPSPVSSRGPRPRTGPEVLPTPWSCWRMRLEPSTRHSSSPRQERGLDHSGPGLIAMYRRYRRLRQEFAERSLVAPQFSCLGDLAGAVWRDQDVVHVQDLAVALGGAAKQRNRVVVVS
jgi:hypothetical protein